MAYHARELLDRRFAARFTNTFIVREPAAALRSLSRIWPDFTLEETGYQQLGRLFDHVLDNGEEPVVVEASDLLQNPEGTVGAYCERLSLPFVPEALSWEAREVSEWGMWGEWHGGAQQSTGVIRSGKEQEGGEPEAELPPQIREAYEHCLPYYERVRAQAPALKRHR